MRIFLLNHGFKLVTNAPNGLERPLVRNTFKLLTKSFYVHVNGTRVTKVIKAPNLIKKLISCENSVAVRCKEVEKLELLRGDVDSLAVELKLVLLKAYLNVLELNDLFVILLGMCVVAAENCLNSCGKLLHIKGLNDKVIGAKLKTKHLVKYLTLCGDHNNGL